MNSLKLSFKNDVRRITAPSTISQLTNQAISLFRVRSPCFQYLDEDGDEITVENQNEYDEFLRQLKSAPMHLKVVESDLLLRPSAAITDCQNISNLPLLTSHLSTSEIIDDSKVSQYLSCITDFSQKQTAAAAINPSLKVTKQTEPDFKVMSQYFELLDLKSSVREIIQSEMANITDTRPKHSVVEYDVTCSVCAETPIRGIIYRCVSCPSFFMCRNCEEICSHSHPAFKIRSLKQFQAINDDITGPQPLRPGKQVLIDALLAMGFKDYRKVVQALQETTGSLEDAVSYLIASS
jgi:hypothetical protein